MRGHAEPMPPLSRRFRGRRVNVDPARVPPGQYVTRDFPVLSAGPTPHTPLDEWSLTLNGVVEEPVSWTWEEFIALPREMSPSTSTASPSGPSSTAPGPG